MSGAHGAAQVLLLGVAGIGLLEMVPRGCQRRPFLRSPRTGLFALWGAMTAGVLALALAALTMLLPTAWGSGAVAHLLHACAPALRVEHTLPWPTVTAVLGAGGLLGGAWSLSRSARATARERRDGRERVLTRVLVSGTPAAVFGPVVLVVEDVKPLAFCLTAPRRIVITTAALDRLDEDEVRAVLAHEHAHLDGRHHLIVTAAEVLARSLPWLRGPAMAREQIARLCEMLADDAAAATYGAEPLITALGEISSGAQPSGALGAGSDVVVRVRRLVQMGGQRPVGRWRSLVVGLASASAFAVVLALPLLDLTAGSCGG